MNTFEFSRPADPAAAVAAARAKTAQQGADVHFLAGGTTLLDLMKLNVETPARVLDINRLPLDKIEATPDGGLRVGATGANSPNQKLIARARSLSGHRASIQPRTAATPKSNRMTGEAAGQKTANAAM